MKGLRLLRSVGYVSMEYAVLFVPGTSILGGLRACWTHVWMACGARGPFCKLIRLCELRPRPSLGSYELNLWSYLMS
ncbi:hypothetical protein PVK06_024269 [Gossypium arboreum]|uniref:Uncharacterized protein n=1 Tax=Gossypium arboreum TaxID=29729 RepID=A0ABR0PDB2_GOSAR|nr:hypothetical protein PVK06_024269 [Gossypium arboreum]